MTEAPLIPAASYLSQAADGLTVELTIVCCTAEDSDRLYALLAAALLTGRLSVNLAEPDVIDDRPIGKALQ